MKRLRYQKVPSSFTARVPGLYSSAQAILPHRPLMGESEVYTSAVPRGRSENPAPMIMVYLSCSLSPGRPTCRVHFSQKKDAGSLHFPLQEDREF
eukprot:636651-Pelagomonas_calceolata.AAC.4